MVAMSDGMNSLWSSASLGGFWGNINGFFFSFLIPVSVHGELVSSRAFCAEVQNFRGSFLNLLVLSLVSVVVAVKFTDPMARGAGNPRHTLYVASAHSLARLYDDNAGICHITTHVGYLNDASVAPLRRTSDGKCK